MAAVRRAFVSAFTSISTPSCTQIPVQSFSSLSSRHHRRSEDETYRPNRMPSMNACADCRFAMVLSVANQYRLGRSYSTMASPIAKSGDSGFSGSLFNLMQRYEDVIGLTEVKEAQRSVLQVCFQNDFGRNEFWQAEHSNARQGSQVSLTILFAHGSLRTGYIALQ